MEDLFAPRPATYFMFPFDNEPIDNAAILNRIEQHLKLNFEPVHDPTKADLHLKTLELYNVLQGLFPSANYSPQDIIPILEKLGYKYADYGMLRYEWMLNKV